MRKKARTAIIYAAAGMGMACYLLMTISVVWIAFRGPVVLWEPVKPIIYFEMLWTLICLPVFLWIVEKGAGACESTSRD